MPTDEPNSPHPWKSKDPDWGIPDRKGMLLSDQIHRFCTQKPGLLIARGYNAERLRPAAYTLTIGDDYADSTGKRGKLSESDPSFEMPPNSIVFVSTTESLDLPYYIAARFNLRVDWVYKGILLGTGPQVEPGFWGRLSCPLYNLTNRPVTITRGELFATIDFERTSSFVDVMPDKVRESAKPFGKLWLYEADGRRLLLFDQKQFKALEKYPDYKIVSSLFASRRAKDVAQNRACDCCIFHRTNNDAARVAEHFAAGDNLECERAGPSQGPIKQHRKGAATITANVSQNSWSEVSLFSVELERGATFP